MSVSSVSSSSNSSILWEELLEQQKKLRQQKTEKSDGTGENIAEAAVTAVSDQESSEAQAQTTSTQISVGSASSGGSGVITKMMQGILEEDDDDENNNGIPDSIEDFIAKLEELQKMLEASDDKKAGNIGIFPSELTPEKLVAELKSISDDPEKLKARAAALSVQVNEAAKEISDGEAVMLKELATDLDDVAKTGDISTMQAKLNRGAGAAQTYVMNGTEESISFGALVDKLRKLKETIDTGETANSESQESLKSLLSSITENLQKQLRAVYAQNIQRV
jgi:hypothetical protein